MLAESGASGVLGLDLSRDAIAEACRRYAAPGLGFRVDNAEEMNSLSPQDQFGLIVSFETIEHLPRPEEFLKRVRTHLSHDGVFFVSTPWRSEGCLEDKPSNPYHVREWDLSEFALLLGGFFSDIRWHVQGLPFREQPHSIVAVVLETLRRLGTKLSGRGSPSSQCHEIVPVPNLRGLQPSFSNPTFIVAEARR
jgi:SAM-dependent methyltransferase